ncbi:MAG: glycosyltransferase family 2 protein [Candidatus Coatesbacteria bacterium]|nr:glycosyltransferase family 2 protein [Candidatus Coatesbacteria bacterium]
MAEISIIIPVKNGSSTIARCIDRLYESTVKDIEIVVVDDCSTDNTIEILEKYPVKIVRLPESKGPSYARNRGVEAATSKYVFLIDSDILVKKDTLEIILDTYRNNPEADAVQGIVSPENDGYENIYNNYQNYYHNFVLSSIKKKWVSITISCVHSIKREAFLKTEGYNELIPHASMEDVEFGYTLRKHDVHIIMNKDLNIIHIHPLTFKTWFWKKFFVGYDHLKFFLRANLNELFKQRLKDRHKYESHQKTSALISLLIAPFTLLSFLLLIINPYYGAGIAILTNIIFLLCNINFFKVSYKQKGFLYTLRIVALCYIDMITMHLALWVSLFHFIFTLKKS